MLSLQDLMYNTGSSDGDWSLCHSLQSRPAVLSWEINTNTVLGMC